MHYFRFCFEMTNSLALNPFNLFRRNKKAEDRRKKISNASFSNVSAYWVSLKFKL